MVSYSVVQWRVFPIYYTTTDNDLPGNIALFHGQKTVNIKHTILNPSLPPLLPLLNTHPIHSDTKSSQFFRSSSFSSSPYQSHFGHRFVIRSIDIVLSPYFGISKNYRSRRNTQYLPRSEGYGGGGELSLGA